MSGRLTTVAPAAITARQTRATKSGSERVASSHENSTSSTRSAAYATAQRARCTTSAGSRPSLRSMWRALVARTTWMRDLPAPASASAAASMSSRTARAKAATAGRSTAARHRAHALEVAGRGAREAGLDDVDSEPLELLRDRRLLVRLQRDARRLLAVAQRRIEDRDPATNGHEHFLLAPRERSHLWCGEVGVCACVRRVFVYLPVRGE